MTRKEIQNIVIKAIAGTIELTEAIDTLCNNQVKINCECGETDEEKLITICNTCSDKMVREGA